MQHCMQCSRWECCPSEHRDDRRGRSECSRFHFDQMRRDVFHSLYICLGCGAGGKRSQTEEIVPVYLGTFLLPDQAVLKSLPIRRAPSAPFLYPPDGPHGGGGHARSMEALLHKPRCVEWRPCPSSARPAKSCPRITRPPARISANVAAAETSRSQCRVFIRSQSATRRAFFAGPRADGSSTNAPGWSGTVFPTNPGRPHGWTHTRGGVAAWRRRGERGLCCSPIAPPLLLS